MTQLTDSIGIKFIDLIPVGDMQSEVEATIKLTRKLKPEEKACLRESIHGPDAVFRLGDDLCSLVSIRPLEIEAVHERIEKIAPVIYGLPELAAPYRARREANIQAVEELRDRLKENFLDKPGK